MQKYLRVTMPDGSKWDVPLLLIAENRAAAIVSALGKEFDKEVESLLKEEYEIIDWAQNIMDWKDVVLQARMVKDAEVDYQEGWMNGKKEIIEK